MKANRKPIQLIVNADDYGYFPGISRGILDAARSGKLTATGILANSPDLKVQLQWLDAVDSLDIGVHLNLTHRRPLTAAMAEKLSRWNGEFPGAYPMSLMILTGQVGINEVRAEWRAQIEACQGRKLVFLNSHEHIHMLPVLFPLILELAHEYRIPHVRLTQAEWLLPSGASALLRNMLLQSMHMINQLRFNTVQAPVLLGLNRSGKLDLAYLAKIFSKLTPGKTYELMCHPGHFHPSEISDRKLIAYHDWEQELALLHSPKLQDLYEKYGICLGHYQS